jgi:RNA polymerase sigma-70 factor (ECF subfamily)
MSEKWADVRLVVLAQSGDRHALGDLLEALQPQLHGYLGRIVGEPPLAADLFQDTCIMVCRRLRQLRDPTLFRPWVYRIANRLATRALRRRGRWISIDQTGVESVQESDEPGDAVLLAEFAAELRDRVVELPPAARVVVALHYWAELTIDETAAALDAPVGTVKSRLAYALGCLRRKLPQE